MVTPMLRELAGPFPPFEHFVDEWFYRGRNIRHLLRAWDRVCDQALRDGSAEDLHASREDYQTVLLGHLKIFDGHLLLLSRWEPDRHHTEELTRARDELQKHYDALFPRWQTLDDLEAILLERISIPNDQLKALAAKSPPPQSWYDEDHSKLTTPE